LPVILIRRKLRTSTADCEFLGRIKGPLNWDDPTLLEELKLKHILPPATLPLNLTDPKNSVYQIHKFKFGWQFFNHYNKQFFSKLKSGFFLEAGALDGEFLSNTLWLEQSQNWSGLLIEADPVNFQYLTWKRRKAWISHTCISEKMYPREAIIESLQETAIGFAVPWLYRANAHELNTYFSNIRGGYTDISAHSYSKVQCFPLRSYLKALNVTTVDYMSLDTQGHEWEMIKTLLKGTISVRVLAVEHFPDVDYIQEGTSIDEKFILYMRDIGFRLIDIDDNTNYIFVLEGDPLLDVPLTKYSHKRNKQRNKR
ncbi:hypothetical protein SK128_002718, partial [Halocaridina rubra]